MSLKYKIRFNMATIYVTCKIDTDKAGGEYKILTIKEAYDWIRSGSDNLLHIKGSSEEVNVPEIKKRLEEDRVLELQNQQGGHWLITKIIT